MRQSDFLGDDGQSINAVPAAQTRHQNGVAMIPIVTQLHAFGVEDDMGLVRYDLVLVAIHVPSVPIEAPKVIGVDGSMPEGREDSNAVAVGFEVIADYRHQDSAYIENSVSLIRLEDAPGDVDAAASPRARIGTDYKAVVVVPPERAVDDTDAVEVITSPKLPSGCRG